MHCSSRISWERYIKLEESVRDKSKALRTTASRQKLQKEILFLAHEFVRVLEEFARPLSECIRAAATNTSRPFAELVHHIRGTPIGPITCLLKWALIAKDGGASARRALHRTDDFLGPVCRCSMSHEMCTIVEHESAVTIAAAVLQSCDGHALNMFHRIGIGSQFNIGLASLFEGGKNGVLGRYVDLNTVDARNSNTKSNTITQQSRQEAVAGAVEAKAEAEMMPHYDQSQHWDAIQSRVHLASMHLASKHAQDRMLAKEFFYAMYRCASFLFAGNDSVASRQALVKTIVQFIACRCKLKSEFVRALLTHAP